MRLRGLEREERPKHRDQRHGQHESREGHRPVSLGQGAQPTTIATQQHGRRDHDCRQKYDLEHDGAVDEQALEPPVQHDERDLPEGADPNAGPDARQGGQSDEGSAGLGEGQGQAGAEDHRRHGQPRPSSLERNRARDPAMLPLQDRIDCGVRIDAQHQQRRQPKQNERHAQAVDQKRPLEDRRRQADRGQECASREQGLDRQERARILGFPRHQDEQGERKQHHAAGKGRLGLVGALLVRERHLQAVFSTMRPSSSIIT